MTPKRNIVFIGLILGLTALLAACSSGAAQSLAQSSQSSFAAGGEQSAGLSTKHYTLVTLQISPSQISLQPGATTQLTATGLGTDNQNHTVTAKITWTSSASSVATVSNAGVVTAITPGTAVITGSKGIQSSSTITVNSQTPDAVPMMPPANSMKASARSIARRRQ